MDTGSEGTASFSGLEQHNGETRQEMKPPATAGVDIQPVPRTRASGDICRRHLLSTEDPLPARPTSANGEDRTCVSGSAPLPKRELENPFTTGGRATVGGGLDAKSSPVVVDPAISWPLSGSGHDSRARKCGPFSHQTQSNNKPVSSLCCRALLSPRTRSPQGLRCVRRRPAVAEGSGAASINGGSFVQVMEASKLGAAAIIAVSGEVMADICSHTRKGSRSRETRKSRNVLSSRSAASLKAPNSAQTAVCRAGGRKKRPNPDYSLAINIGHPDGGRSADHDLRSCSRTRKGREQAYGTLSSRGRREGNKTGRCRKPSEVPEWSPTATFENGDGEVTESGSACVGHDGDFGFGFAMRESRSCIEMVETAAATAAAAGAAVAKHSPSYQWKARGKKEELLLVKAYPRPTRS